MKTRTLLVASPLLLSPLYASPVLAEAEDDGTWSGSTEFGAAITTGNTDSSTLNGKLKIGYESEPWKHLFRLEALKASEDGEDTADRILAEFESDYSLSERDYLFGALRGTRDEFSAYDYQASVAAGYGRKLWISEKGYWDAEIGPGVRVSETDDGERETNLIARMASGFEYQFSDFAKFNQDVTVLAGENNTEIESVTGLTSSLTETLAMKLSYTVQHNTEVPAGTEKTDTYTSVNIVYNFD
jgi:putative salt-induced outer membrane protein